MLLLWPGEVRRKREDGFGQIGPALLAVLAGTNNSDLSINKIPSTSYCDVIEEKVFVAVTTLCTRSAVWQKILNSFLQFKLK